MAKIACGYFMNAFFIKGQLNLCGVDFHLAADNVDRVRMRRLRMGPSPKVPTSQLNAYSSQSRLCSGMGHVGSRSFFERPNIDSQLIHKFKRLLKMSYRFYIELEASRPLVWRRIVVPKNYNLYKLHLGIQGAFGWENCHLFEFCEQTAAAGTRFGIPDGFDPDPEVLDAKKAKVSKLFREEGQKSIYIYDFGDYWKHWITLEKVDSEDLVRPYCLDGAGACPPEDVGGMYGYREMLEAFGRPESKEAKDYREWLGLSEREIWDAVFCSVREVNRRLCLLI
jgi:hypothetical protein